MLIAKLSKLTSHNTGRNLNNMSNLKINKLPVCLVIKVVSRSIPLFYYEFVRYFRAVSLNHFNGKYNSELLCPVIKYLAFNVLDIGSLFSQKGTHTGKRALYLQEVLIFYVMLK